MAHMMESIRKVALLGNHLPRQCGIATFTTDLAEAIGGLEQRIECAVVAVNDAGRIFGGKGGSHVLALVRDLRM
jgi:hypothetical protein